MFFCPVKPRRHRVRGAGAVPGTPRPRCSAWRGCGAWHPGRWSRRWCRRSGRRRSPTAGRRAWSWPGEGLRAVGLARVFFQWVRLWFLVCGGSLQKQPGREDAVASSGSNSKRERNSSMGKKSNVSFKRRAATSWNLRDRETEGLPPLLHQVDSDAHKSPNGTDPSTNVELDFLGSKTVSLETISPVGSTGPASPSSSLTLSKRP